MNAFSSDLISLLYIPVLISTILLLRKNWHSLWDSSITRSDRTVLKQVAFFMGMPVMTLVHEFGHLIAFVLMGFHINKFHYALYWGYVEPAGLVNTQQAFIGALAGNALEVALALAIFGIALISKTPGVVALCVYTACMALGFDLIIYPLMSLTGYYGDWTRMYETPIYAWTVPLAVIHISLVLALIAGLKSNRVKFWYIRKTNAQWFQEYDYLVTKANLEPSADNWVALGWSYYGEELYDHARKCIDRALNLDADCSEAYVLLGMMALDKENLDDAEKCFTLAANKSSSQATANENPELARAYMAIGSVYERQHDLKKAESFYDKAYSACLSLGDAKVLLATMLNKLGKHNDACKVLLEAQDLPFIDNNLKAQLGTELELARRKLDH